MTKGRNKKGPQLTAALSSYSRASEVTVVGRTNASRVSRGGVGANARSGISCHALCGAAGPIVKPHTGAGAAVSHHFRYSGEISLGKNNGISGHTMHAASTRSMGTSMIIVSLSANRSGTLATAQEIMRHRP
jgi:hypothetical protein